MVRSREGRPAVIDMAVLAELAGRWRERWPSAQQPSADACLNIVNARDLLLQALSQEAAKSSALPHNVSATALQSLYLLISRGDLKSRGEETVALLSSALELEAFATSEVSWM